MDLRKWWVVMVLLVLINIQNYYYGAKAAPQVPCYFIFGDSLVDNGNNNQLSSLARANYLPYGIDFPNGPTGRFSNGKTTVDVIAQLLGFDGYIPPYSAARVRIYSEESIMHLQLLVSGRKLVDSWEIESVLVGR